MYVLLLNMIISNNNYKIIKEIYTKQNKVLSSNFLRICNRCQNMDNDFIHAVGMPGMKVNKTKHFTCIFIDSANESLKKYC